MPCALRPRASLSSRGQSAGARPASGAPAHRRSIRTAHGGVHARTPLNAPREEETRKSSSTQVFETHGAPHAPSAAVTAGDATCVPGAPGRTHCRTPGPDSGACAPGPAAPGSVPHPFLRLRVRCCRLRAGRAPRVCATLYFKHSFLPEDFRIHLSTSHQFPTQTRPKGLVFLGWCLFLTELNIFSVQAARGMGDPRRNGVIPHRHHFE